MICHLLLPEPFYTVRDEIQREWPQQGAEHVYDLHDFGLSQLHRAAAEARFLVGI